MTVSGRSPDGSGCEATPSAASRLRKVASLTREYGATVFQRSAPFLLCTVGGALCAFMGEKGWHWVLGICAGVFWAWAVDLASARAEAKATSKVAAQFAAMVMDDHNCEITVTNKHTYYAATADLDTIASAIEARRAETHSGSVADESAVGNAETPNRSGGSSHD